MKELDDRIERAVGSAPVRYELRPGGYSTADRFAVTLADSRRVFVKSAGAPNLAGWLRREHEVYTALSGSFIPALVGWASPASTAIAAGAMTTISVSVVDSPSAWAVSLT